MLAADGRLHAEELLDLGGTGVEIGDRVHEVVTSASGPAAVAIALAVGFFAPAFAAGAAGCCTFDPECDHRPDPQQNRRANLHLQLHFARRPLPASFARRRSAGYFVVALLRHIDLALERLAVPAGQVGRGLVGALENVQQRRLGVAERRTAS